MTKSFLQDIVSLDELRQELADLEFSVMEELEILELAEEVIHHNITDALISRLRPDRHEEFLLTILEDSHHDTWVILNQEIPDAVDLITKHYEIILQTLLRDILDIREGIFSQDEEAPE